MFSYFIFCLKNITMTFHGKFTTAIEQNNTEIVLHMLKHKKFSDLAAKYHCTYWDAAICNNSIEVTNVLLNDNKFNPIKDIRSIINSLSKNSSDSICKIFWDDKRIKYFLKSNHSDVYNKFRSLDLQDNLINF